MLFVLISITALLMILPVVVCGRASLSALAAAFGDLLVAVNVLYNEPVLDMPSPVEQRTFDGIEFVWIPPGRFRMGSPSREVDRYDDEGPVHTVQITKGFWMAKFPVTQGQYKRVMRENPSRFEGSDRPVECVSWTDAMEFCGRLSKRRGGAKYRLPTEAEWEYACRAGTTTRFHTGDRDAKLDRAGWYDANSDCGTCAVGKKAPNAWGLYDMHGNVLEWCADKYASDYYRNSSRSDPTGPKEGLYQVLRGGSWFRNACDCRSAFRFSLRPDDRGHMVGFRLVRSGDDYASKSDFWGEPSDTSAGDGASGKLDEESVRAKHERPRYRRGRRPRTAPSPGERRRFAGIEFVWVPPGEFRMGSPGSEEGRDGDEGPSHTVRITKGFWMGKFPVTQGQYKPVMGENPSHFKGEDRPVELVSWEKAARFCRELKKRTGVSFRLPTEAEWEYACRAGTTTRFHSGDSDSDLDEVGWFDGNSGGQTHPVGQKAPNAWGLHDMHGNVYEWCSDVYDGKFYYTSPGADPSGPVGGSRRAERGGGWSNRPRYCRSAYRNHFEPLGTSNNLGLRLVRCCTLSASENATWEKLSETFTIGEESSDESVERTGEASKRQRVDARRRGGESEEELRPGEQRTFDGIEFVWVPPGKFSMGSPGSEEGRDGDEGPLHAVRITKGFWMAKFPITQEQYERLMGNNPSCFRSADLPVDSVSWDDSVAFCRELSERSGVVYRLPTEAEWEYACRAGTTTRFYTGDSESDLDRSAWHHRNSKEQTHPVGEKAPNAWGLCDMHGNVWEWCSDWFAIDYYGTSPASDPPGPAHGSNRVMRGGCCNIHPWHCRSANRCCDMPANAYFNIGFRIVRSPDCLASVATIWERLNEAFAAAHFASDEPEEKPKETSHGPSGESHARRSGESRRPGELRTFDGIEFVWIPAGQFQMGSPFSEDGRDGDESPVRSVRITKGFWMGRFPVTQEQYERAMGKNPSCFRRADLPVDSVSWDDSVAFCRELSERSGVACRLPTEAEWEYACRAGTMTRFHTGNSEPKLSKAGWYHANSAGWTHRVGRKAPNAWGLYDVHGNVWEWCWDWYDADWFAGRPNPDLDPRGPSAGANRVRRGGSWYEFALYCRSASRDSRRPYYRHEDSGFRIVRTSD